MLATALRHRYQPINAHIVPIRRCNLACAYCNEFDDHSPPVPLAEMIRRIDRLAELGTGVVTVSGGEPLLHPDLDRIIRHIRDRGMIATVITNGYLLSVERIRRLDAAGLDHLQISIDNAVPDEVSKKSRKLLDRKLVRPARRVAQVDQLRERPGETLNEWFAPRAGVEVRWPAAVQVLQWLFVTGRCSRQFRSAAGWLLGAR